MINPLARQLSIDLITDTYNPIIEWFNSIWCKLQIIETNVYHDLGGEYIYFIDDGSIIKQWIFFRDDKNERFWCNYNHYWSFFETNYDIKYTDIQEVTRLLVENALNNEVATPRRYANLISKKVENALNNEVATPRLQKHNPLQHVENALNNEVATPTRLHNDANIVVENALNNEIATPVRFLISAKRSVENALNNEVATPRIHYGVVNARVEDALNNTTNE